jgi:type IV secretory pathway TraG/TraD family ATPase VirD4
MAKSNVSIKGGVDRTHSDKVLKQIIMATPTRSGKGISFVTPDPVLDYDGIVSRHKGVHNG